MHGGEYAENEAKTIEVFTDCLIKALEIVGSVVKRLVNRINWFSNYFGDAA